ncbi:uncharacterized protein [Branchiostoma lanceolatum]|uniref:uncharacterized protein n=1 Tax=Branchiostoma lanceolatum TaxID=7740 RepID=UPI0034571508
MTSPIVGRFCTPTRMPIVSSARKLLVTFRSDNSFDSHFLMKYSFYSTAKSGQRWRDDGRCGWKYPAAAAASAQCAPDGETPCCSSNGRCRSTDADCTCPNCVDYRNVDNAGMPTNPASAEETQTLGSECYEDLGETYRRTVSTTWSGKACQAWSSQTPHQHSFNPATYPNLGLDNNYCRNPDLKRRPWCYTTDPTKAWDYCMLSKCTGPVSRAVYIGCYKDTSSRTFPGGRLHDNQKMTAALCINHCSGLGYNYAATQYSNECFCGNEANFAQLEPPRPESECNRPCAGDTNEKCGGAWRNSVYKLPGRAPSVGYSCGDGLNKFNGRCYKVVTEKKSNEEAKNECSRMGGRLAAPKTAEIHRFLVELAKKKVGSGQAVWIGLQKGEEEAVWKYSDGSTLGVCTFSNWAPGEPKADVNTKCVQYWASKSYKWDDTYCSYTKAFICETVK